MVLLALTTNINGFHKPLKTLFSKTKRIFSASLFDTKQDLGERRMAAETMRLLQRRRQSLAAEIHLIFFSET
jgi:hypothetical protein